MMTPKDKAELISFLRNIGDDFVEDGSEVSPECKACESEKEDKDCCPSHKDCGRCRYEYMKQKGWLKEVGE